MTRPHLFVRLAGFAANLRRRSRERAELAALDDRDLRDLGLSRATVSYEVNKPFWRF